MKNLDREIDPALIRVIKEALKTNAIFSAAFILVETAADISPERVEHEVHKLVATAEKAVASKASRVVVFKSMASFAIEGPAKLIHEITKSPKIQCATLNKAP